MVYSQSAHMKELCVAACIWCDEERGTMRRLEPGQRRECPVCDKVFQGNGWDGVDAHWKAKHEPAAISYADFWAGISACARHRK